jgi:hypothetical protein
VKAIWRGIRGFGRFWYDFVVGDDWRVAAGAAVGLAAAAALAHAGIPAWWFLPLAIGLVLVASIRRAVAGRDR